MSESASTPGPPATEAAASDSGERLIYRHTPAVRIMHWVNVFCLFVLLMSGFQIFNAHPSLYWGERSDRDRPLLAIRADVSESGEPKGATSVFGHEFNTTGVLGVSKDSWGRRSSRGFPAWATLPSERWLAMARRWHLFFAWWFVANGIAFALYAFISGHLSRDLLPRVNELKRIGKSVVDHLLLRHQKGEEATRYNVLQKLAYLVVIFALGPLIVLTGLTMSPMLNAAFPELLTLFGGRQSARTIHFLAAFGFIAFTLIHVFMVIATGLLNNLQAMLTGWYRINEDKSRE